MQRAQINLSWTDKTTSLVPVLQNMKMWKQEMTELSA